MQKEEKWYKLKGKIFIRKNSYKCHRTWVNYKCYTTSRLVYKAFHPEFNLEYTKNITIDHINRNSLDNRLCNLRIATMSEQIINRECVIHAKGYYFNKQTQKWIARIGIQGKTKHLGSFKTESEARIARLVAKAEHLGNA
jgi:hypothetical protein